MSSAAPHYFRGGFYPDLLSFCVSSPGFFCVIEAQTDQEMQIIPVLKASSDVIVEPVRGGWPPRHIKGRSLSKKMRGDWVKLSERVGLQRQLGFPAMLRVTRRVFH